MKKKEFLFFNDVHHLVYSIFVLVLIANSPLSYTFWIFSLVIYKSNFQELFRDNLIFLWGTGSMQIYTYVLVRVILSEVSDGGDIFTFTSLSQSKELSLWGCLRSLHHGRSSEPGVIYWGPVMSWHYTLGSLCRTHDLTPAFYLNGRNTQVVWTLA